MNNSLYIAAIFATVSLISCRNSPSLSESEANSSGSIDVNLQQVAFEQSTDHALELISLFIETKSIVCPYNLPSGEAVADTLRHDIGAVIDSRQSEYEAQRLLLHLIQILQKDQGRDFAYELLLATPKLLSRESSSRKHHAIRAAMLAGAGIAASDWSEFEVTYRCIRAAVDQHQFAPEIEADLLRRAAIASQNLGRTSEASATLAESMSRLDGLTFPLANLQRVRNLKVALTLEDPGARGHALQLIAEARQQLAALPATLDQAQSSEKRVHEIDLDVHDLYSRIVTGELDEASAVRECLELAHQVDSTEKLLTESLSQIQLWATKKNIARCHLRIMQLAPEPLDLAELERCYGEAGRAIVMDEGVHSLVARQQSDSLREILPSYKHYILQTLQDPQEVGWPNIRWGINALAKRHLFRDASDHGDIEALREFAVDSDLLTIMMAFNWQRMRADPEVVSFVDPEFRTIHDDTISVFIELMSREGSDTDRINLAKKVMMVMERAKDGGLTAALAVRRGDHDPNIRNAIYQYERGFLALNHLQLMKKYRPPDLSIEAVEAAQTRTQQMFRSACEVIVAKAPSLLWPLPETVKSPILSLPSKSLLINFYVGEQRLFVMVAEPEESVRFYAFRLPEAALDQMCLQLNRAVQHGHHLERVKDSGGIFYKSILEYILSKYNSNIETLYISPHRCLDRVPFEAAFDGTQFLFQRYSIAYLPNASWTLAARSAASFPSTVAVAGCSYGLPDRGLSELESTAAEIDLVADAFARCFPRSRVIALRADAQRDRPKVQSIPLTKSSFFRTLSQTDVVHFIGHAYHDANDPLRSFMVVGDVSGTRGEPLYTSELYDLRPSSCRLFVFAACSSAMMTSIGPHMVGLSRPLRAAGVECVIAPTEPVSEATARLVTSEFYSRLGNSRISFVAAWGATIRALLNRGYDPAEILKWRLYGLDSIGSIP